MKTHRGFSKSIEIRFVNILSFKAGLYGTLLTKAYVAIMIKER